MNKIAVVIPVHKSSPTQSELDSLRQCMKILPEREFIWCVADDFDNSIYEKECGKKVNFKVERFENSFFENYKGYNKLLMSADFYKRFEDFDFIFIYQLDAFIFYDELDFWSKQHYDNIGAPWFQGFDKPTVPYVFTGAGNGGCAFRKVSSCIRVLTTFKYIHNPFKNLWNHFSPIQFIKDFTIHNNFHYRYNNYKLHEDYFFAHDVPRKFKWFKNCPPEIALKFSFETAPSYLYKINDNKLPMCCHAYEKYEYEFWKPFIEKQISEQ